MSETEPNWLTESSQPPPAVQRNGFGDIVPHAGQGTQVEQARAIAEVRAAVMIAMERPRNRPSAIAEMREVCQIYGLAERAFFRVKRGATKNEKTGRWEDAFVNGESIHLARELARCWGNIDYGVKELAQDPHRGQSELLAFAWDMQTNARSEITFIVPHERGSGEKRKRLVGTQEIYENNASFAGRRLREAIFSILPVWFKEEAASICHDTLRKGQGGKPIEQRRADVVQAFAGIGVEKKQIEVKSGKPVEEMTAEDLAQLGVIYKSIKRNEVTAADEFPVEEVAKPLPENADAFEKAVTGQREAEPAPSGTLPERMHALVKQIDACMDNARLPALRERADAYLAEAKSKPLREPVEQAMQRAQERFAHPAQGTLA